MNLDQPLFGCKYGDSVRYKNQCLTSTIYNVENRIFCLKIPILIFFYSKSYLDLYVFFYVKTNVFLILIPVFIAYVLFLPFVFSELELVQRFAQRRSIT